MKVRLEITRVGLMKMKCSVVFSVFKGKNNMVCRRQTLLYCDLLSFRYYKRQLWAAFKKLF